MGWIKERVHGLLDNVLWQIVTIVFGGGLMTAIGTLIAAYLQKPVTVLGSGALFLICALSLLVLFLFLARKRPTGHLLQSSPTQSPAGITADQIKELEKLYSQLHSEMTAPIEASIRAHLSSMSAPERENHLFRVVTVGWIYIQFEEVWYGGIFASQINCLHKLNGTPMKRVDVYSEFYVPASVTYPFVYSTYTFDQWLGWIRGRVLIREDGDSVSITIRGRDFLKYLIDNARTASDKSF